MRARIVTFAAGTSDTARLLRLGALWTAPAVAAADPGCSTAYQDGCFQLHVLFLSPFWLPCTLVMLGVLAGRLARGLMVRRARTWLTLAVAVLAVPVFTVVATDAFTRFVLPLDGNNDRAFLVGPALAVPFAALCTWAVARACRPDNVVT